MSEHSRRFELDRDHDGFLFSQDELEMAMDRGFANAHQVYSELWFAVHDRLREGCTHYVGVTEEES